MTDEIPLVTTPPMIERTLREDITKILNRHHVENASDTPDFILAQYLLRSLVAGEELVKARHAWLGLPNPWAQKLTDLADPADTPEDTERIESIAEDAVTTAVNGIADAMEMNARAAHTARVPPEHISDADLLEWMGTDAERWAYEFARKQGEVENPNDIGWLIGWFANAIMAGYDGRARQEREEGRPSPTTNADLD